MNSQLICRRVKSLRVQDLTKNQREILNLYVREVAFTYRLTINDVKYRLGLFEDNVSKKYISHDVWSIRGIAYLYLHLEGLYDLGAWSYDVNKILRPKGKTNPLYRFIMEDEGMRIWYKYAEALVDKSIENSLMAEVALQRKTETRVLNELSGMQLLERCFNMSAEPTDIEKLY